MYECLRRFRGSEPFRVCAGVRVWTSLYWCMVCLLEPGIFIKTLSHFWCRYLMLLFCIIQETATKRHSWANSRKAGDMYRLQILASCPCPCPWQGPVVRRQRGP